MRRFLNPAPRQDPRVHLVCLPYAGAGAAVYRTWGADLPPEIEVWAAQLPGKGWRLGEEPISDLDHLADAVAEAVLAEVPKPLAVFGHSMGAWLGLEVVRRLESAGIRPRSLFVSGLQAPFIGHIRPPISHLDDDAFIDTVDQRYGGIPPEVLADRDLLMLLLPALRADLVALEGFEPLVGAPVEAPIVAMRGASDPLVTEDQLLPWAKATNGPFRVRQFPGGHFYFDQAPGPLQRELSMSLLEPVEAEKPERHP